MRCCPNRPGRTSSSPAAPFPSPSSSSLVSSIAADCVPTAGRPPHRPGVAMGLEDESSDDDDGDGDEKPTVSGKKRPRQDDVVGPSNKNNKKKKD